MESKLLIGFLIILSISTTLQAADDELDGLGLYAEGNLKYYELHMSIVSLEL